MKHGVWINEENRILGLRFMGHCNGADFKELCDQCQSRMNGHQLEKAIIDLSQIESFPDEDERDRLVGQLRQAGVEKVALVCNRPEVKIVGIMLQKHLASHADTRFFVGEDEALEWLLGSANAN